MEEKSREERNGFMNFKVKNTKRVFAFKKKKKLMKKSFSTV